MLILTLIAFVTVQLLGLVTLARICIRNRNTDRYKRKLDIIRQYFRDNYGKDTALRLYRPFHTPKNPFNGSAEDEISTQERLDGDEDYDKVFSDNLKPRTFGGLAHTMAIVNSLVFGAILAVIIMMVATALQNQGSQPKNLQFGTVLGFSIAGAAFLAIVMSFVGMLWYISHREAYGKKEERKSIPTHAGAVIYTVCQDKIKYLLVRSSSGKDWVLPKGKIEPREEHSAAAIREVCEEGACLITIESSLDLVEYVVEKENNPSNTEQNAKEPKKEWGRCKYYLANYVRDVGRTEERQRMWTDFDEAMSMLSKDFREVKHVIGLAAGRLGDGRFPKDLYATEESA